jgi:copper homeostasis protein
MKLEACIETLAEAKLAAKHGIDRVELCSALDLGGLTPSAALIKASAKIIETHVLIRPRAGDFVYTTEEIEWMNAEIVLAAKYGASGVVFGCLNHFNQVDVDNNKRLVNTAKKAGLQCTFHRAFDFIFEMDTVLELIIDLGFQRILTSGGQATAKNGLNQIMKLITKANGRIEIMAGSGVNASNIKTIQAAGVDAAHFSIRKKQNRIVSLNMGAQYEVDEEKMLNIIKTLTK